MARPREFDTDEALEAAMQTFWLQGYEATSLADLMTAMGLQKGSIYKAFKDKRSLFISALKRYFKQKSYFHKQYLEKAQSAKEGLSEWLHQLVENLSNHEDCRGCLLVNSLVELAPHDDEVKQLLTQQSNYLQKLLCQVIIKGQKQGEFRTDISAEDLSKLLLNLVYGLITNSKKDNSLVALQRQGEVAMKVLE